MKKGLSENAMKFLRLYVENGNATESYFNTFRIKNRQQRNTMACKLLKKQESQEYLQLIKQEKQEREDAEKDKWKEKREKILNGLYDMAVNRLVKPSDRIKASTTFLQNISKYEQVIKENEEDDNDKTLKNTFEVIEKLIDGDDLEEYENVEEN